MRNSHTWLRRVGAAAVVVLVGLVLLDLLVGVLTAPAAWAQHGIGQVVVWPFVLADAMGLVMHSAGFAVLQWAVIAPACVWLARSADGGTRTSQIQMDVVFATPLLLLGVAAVVAGLSAAPPVVVGCLLAAGFGGLAAQTGDEKDVVLPGSGMPAGPLRYAAVAGGVLGLVVGAPLLAIGSEPAVSLWEVSAWVSPWMWPWLVALVACGVAASGSALDRPGAWGRVAAAGMFGVFVTVVFVGWTAPDRRWERIVAAAPLPLAMAALGGLWMGAGLPWRPTGRRPTGWLVGVALPVLAGVLGLVHTFAVGAVDCSRGAASPFTTLVTPEPGVLVTGLDGDVWVITPEATLRRWGGAEGIDVDLAGAVGGAAQARTLGVVDDELRVWLSTEQGAVWLRVRDGDVVERHALDGQCVVGAWSLDDDGGVATCTWGHRVLRDGEAVESTEIQGAGGIDALIPDGAGGWLGIDRWTHPYLVRVDRVGRLVSERVLVGSWHGELRRDEGSGVVAVARTLAGQIQFMDGASLDLRGAVRAEWGLRELVSTRWAWVGASPATGGLVAVDPDDGVIARLLSPGVQDIALLNESTLVTAGRCGVETVDLKGWLGR